MSLSLSQEKLEKAAEAYEAAEDLHAAFVARMDKWMIDNYGRAIDLFRRFDIDGDGSLSYEEFYAGMRDLNAPANNLELYVLAKKLDRDNNGMLDYLEFSKGLKYYKKEECVPDDGLPTLRFEREELENCPCCKLGLWKPPKEKFPRYDNVSCSGLGSTPGSGGGGGGGATTGGQPRPFSISQGSKENFLRSIHDLFL